MRICVIPNDVTKTDEIGALAFVGVGQCRFERFEIPVNIAEDGEAHFLRS
jgi:hypothetical protein